MKYNLKYFSHQNTDDLDTSVILEGADIAKQNGLEASAAIIPVGLLSMPNAVRSRALSRNFPYRRAFSFNLCLGSLSETITASALSNIRVFFYTVFSYLLLCSALNICAVLRSFQSGSRFSKSLPLSINPLNFGRKGAGLFN